MSCGVPTCGSFYRGGVSQGDSFTLELVHSSIRATGKETQLRGTGERSSALKDTAGDNGRRGNSAFRPVKGRDCASYTRGVTHRRSRHNRLKDDWTLERRTGTGAFGLRVRFVAWRIPEGNSTTLARKRGKPLLRNRLHGAACHRATGMKGDRNAPPQIGSDSKA